MKNTELIGDCTLTFKNEEFSELNVNIIKELKGRNNKYYERSFLLKPTKGMIDSMNDNPNFTYSVVLKNKEGVLEECNINRKKGNCRIDILKIFIND
jgi:hypothetical protein